MPNETQPNFAAIVPPDSERRRYSAGEAIFKEGDPGDAMYVVMSGHVRISHGNRSLELVEGGGIFGEMALADPAPRSAAATAETDCEVVPVDANRFQFMVHHTPFFALQVMRIMTGRLRAMNARDRLTGDDDLGHA